MADRVRIIEGTWRCTSCDAQDLPGRHKLCPVCGNPREAGKESQFEFGGATAPSASDPKALELARAGVDWYCAYCGAGNRGDLPRCKNCSAERVKVIAPTTPPAERAPTPASAAAARPRPRRTGCWVVLAVLGSLGLGVCGLGLWAAQTHAYPSEVSAMRWEREVHRERFSPVEAEAWRDQIPSQAPVMPVNGAGESAGASNVRDCRSKQRSTRKVADGQEEVCHSKTRRQQCGTEEQCTRQDLGNGFAEERCRDVPKYCSETYEECRMETKYRSEPVHDDWCVYTTHAWIQVDTARASGADASPSWPESQSGPLDRLVRSEKYSVSFEYEAGGEKQQNAIEPKTEAEFVAWKLGQQAILTVSNAGSVTSVKPAP